jgi:hypothetical protein
VDAIGKIKPSQIQGLHHWRLSSAYQDEMVSPSTSKYFFACQTFTMMHHQAPTIHIVLGLPNSTERGNYHYLRKSGSRGALYLGFWAASQMDHYGILAHVDLLILQLSSFEHSVPG